MSSHLPLVAWPGPAWPPAHRLPFPLPLFNSAMVELSLLLEQTHPLVIVPMWEMATSIADRFWLSNVSIRREKQRVRSVSRKVSAQFGKKVRIIRSTSIPIVTLYCAVGGYPECTMAVHGLVLGQKLTQSTSRRRRPSRTGDPPATDTISTSDVGLDPHLCQPEPYPQQIDATWRIPDSVGLVHLI